jgi:hypothetical protein
MASESYTGYIYRLRAGSPMPVTGSPGSTTAIFKLHTFGAEKSEVTIYECTLSLPVSTQFKGQGGNLVSANFSRIGDTRGHYQGREVYAPTYIDESSLGFNY